MLELISVQGMSERTFDINSKGFLHRKLPLRKVLPDICGILQIYFKNFWKILDEFFPNSITSVGVGFCSTGSYDAL